MFSHMPSQTGLLVNFAVSKVTRMARKGIRLARMVMVIIIVRWVMRLVMIVIRMVIMMVGRGIIMARIKYEFGHLE